MSPLEFEYTMEKIIKHYNDHLIELNPNTIRKDWPVVNQLNSEGKYINESEEYIEDEKNLEKVFLDPEFFEK